MDKFHQINKIINYLIIKYQTWNIKKYNQKYLIHLHMALAIHNIKIILDICTINRQFKMKFIIIHSRINIIKIINNNRFIIINLLIRLISFYIMLHLILIIEIMINKINILTKFSIKLYKQTHFNNKYIIVKCKILIK